MQPPESSESLGKRWLDDARSELRAASSPLPDGVWPSVWCFHAQRAAEKAVKAVLEFRHVEIDARQRKIHNLDRLVGMLGLDEIPPELADAGELTQYAVDTHYIDDLGDPAHVTIEHMMAAIEIAKRAVVWAEAIIDPQ